MANPILEAIQLQNRTMQLKNSPLEMLQEFNKFKNQMKDKNPQQMVMNLINSGQMSKQQFERLKEQAIQLSQFLK